MFHQRIVDYTRLPLGQQTRRGVIAACERCGRHGAFQGENDAQGGQKETWLHIEQTGLFTGGYEDVCIRATHLVDGQAVREWEWKSLERA